MTSAGFRTALEAWILGVVAYGLGFLGTYGLEGDRPRDDTTLVRGENLGSDGAYTVGELRDLGDAGEMPTAVEFAGWLHHRAHFAALEGTVRFDGGSPVPVEVPLEPGALTYLLPGVLLFVGGYWLSARYRAPNAVVAAARGAYVAIGYLLPAVATVFLLEWQFAAGSSVLVIRPEPATAIAMTGIIYPVLAGGVGGFLAHEIHAEDPVGEQFG